jgi:hypothetical protein
MAYLRYTANMGLLKLQNWLPFDAVVHSAAFGWAVRFGPEPSVLSSAVEKRKN